ncbi:MAG: hypothetical protein M1813_002205 [Trichoglossum hirsutum]|nr:MAG: hypothetical protein M1813_002205 [Trichoglossum hirsutum]
MAAVSSTDTALLSTDTTQCSNAELCQLFTSYLSNEHATCRDLAEEQQARFNIWAANIGDFADVRASLDHSLRDGPEVQSILYQLLDVVHRNLRFAIIIDGTRNLAGNGPPSERSTFKATFWQSSPESKQTLTLEAFQAIKETIDRLQRLSTAIRQSSTQHRNPKAIPFIERDKYGDDIGSEFESYAVCIIKHRYKDANDALCRQLGASIFFRRNRFLYRKRQQERLAPNKQGITLGQPLADRGADYASQQDALFSPITSQSKTTRGAALSVTTASVLPASPLDSRAFQSVAFSHTPSVASSIPSVSVENNKLDYPVPPIFKTGQKECECPYCFESLQKADASDERRWRRHVDRDLEPYVCVSEVCKGSLEFFSKFEDWLGHMWKKHAAEWYCDATIHPPQVFSGKDDFEAHMRSSHAGTFTELQLPILTEKNTRPGSRPRPFTLCPLCNCIPQDIAELNERQGCNALDLLPKHVAGHLKSLAFLSLPWREDILGEDEVENKVIEAASHDASLGKKDKIRGRETDSVFNSETARTPLLFDDNPLAREFSNDLSPLETRQRAPVPDEFKMRPGEPEWGFIPQDTYDQINDPTLQPFIAKASVPTTKKRRTTQSIRPIFMVPFERDKKFVGRSDTITEINEKLKTQRRVALAGIGGVG